MLTREQWEALARFAGVEGEYARSGWYREVDDEFAQWMPHKRWNDFGPLLVLIGRWYDKATIEQRETVDALMDDMTESLHKGTEQELMQAGCLLGARIGMTMKE